MKVSIEVSEEQAKLILKALDFYGRIQLGQLEELLSFSSPIRDRLISKDLTESRFLLDKIKKDIFGLESNSFFSIMNKNEVPEEARLGYDMIQVLRNKIAYANKPEGGITVDFDSPMQTSLDNNLIKVDILK